MEVLVSVAIITVVGMALMQIASNNTKLIQFILEKKGLNNDVSIVAPTIERGDNKREKALDDIVREIYTIPQDETRRALKEKKIKIYHDEDYRYRIYDTTDDSTNVNNGERKVLLTLEFDKYRISDGKQNAFWHRITATK